MPVIKGNSFTRESTKTNLMKMVTTLTAMSVSNSSRILMNYWTNSRGGSHLEVTQTVTVTVRKSQPLLKIKEPWTVDVS